jgi:toxin-antitoxin system PIN domain toxin
MIVPDVNVLLHAYNAGSRRHTAFKSWWEAMLSGNRPVGLAWPALLGFIRVSTHPKIMEKPLPVERAIMIVRSWIAAPCAEMIWPGSRHAEILFGLLEAAGTAGNLTTDAHIAAMAIEYEAEVATTDLDFGRFAGLRWFIPGEASRR